MEFGSSVDPNAASLQVTYREFSTVSESLTEADLAIREGTWSEYMEKAVNAVPEWATGIAKNVVMTKDSAVFRALNRMVQYGDFVAKAVLYDHLKETGAKEEEALDQISQQFVQYNRNTTRARDAIESLGLFWFGSYKLRIMPTALQQFRERPLQFIATVFGIGPMAGVDTAAGGSPGLQPAGRLDPSDP